MRRAGGQRRGLQNTLRRKTTCRRNNTNSEKGASASVFLIQTCRWISKEAEKSYQFAFTACSALGIIPLVKHRGVEGKYIRAPLWRITIMCLFYLTIVMSMCQKLWVCYRRIAHESNLDITTMLSFILLWFQLMALCPSIAYSLRPSTTANVLNSSNELLENIQDLSPGKKMTPCSSTIVAVQLLMNFVGPLFGSCAISLFLSMYMAHAPIFGLSILENIGVVRLNTDLPRWLWSLVFYPLEVYQIVLPYLAFTAATQSNVMELGMLRVCLMQLRKASVRDLKSRSEMQKIYNLLQVHTALVEEWLKPALVPLYFSVGGSVVFLLYFPLRYSELPAIIGVAFYPTAFVLMFTVMWVSLDVVKMVGVSQEIVGKLQTVSELPSFLDSDERKRLVKTAKALRPVKIPLGGFTNFSMDGPVVLWEEMLNQLLFLLSF